MALNFPGPSQVATQYLTILASLKPEVNVGLQDSDWWIRSQVVGGVISGMYADQQLVSQDCFPQSARIEALQNHLYTYLNRGLIPPQPSNGDVGVTGSIGTDVPQGTEFVYQPNGNVYQTTEDFVLTATTGSIPIQSIGVGQVQNLLAGTTLLCSTPPSGLNGTAVTLTAMAGGRDQETAAEAAAAILAFIQQPPAGGTASDYVAFAMQGSPQVVSATVIRFMFGLGSLGIVITAGTTDIDSALNEGVPIVLVPTPAILAQVQAYVDTQAIVTDCVTVLAPVPVNVNIDVWVRIIPGTTLATIEPNTGLTYQALIQREVQRAIYKTPPGGRQFNGVGFLVASEIEQQLDASLSAEPYATGQYAQILQDRQVYIEGASDDNPDLQLGPTNIAIPNNINVNLITP